MFWGSSLAAALTVTLGSFLAKEMIPSQGEGVLGILLPLIITLIGVALLVVAATFNGNEKLLKSVNIEDDPGLIKDFAENAATDKNLKRYFFSIQNMGRDPTRLECRVFEDHYSRAREEESRRTIEDQWREEAAQAIAKLEAEEEEDNRRTIEDQRREEAAQEVAKPEAEAEDDK